MPNKTLIENATRGIHRIMSVLEQEIADATNAELGPIAAMSADDLSRWELVRDFVRAENFDAAASAVSGMDTACRDYVDTITNKEQREAVAKVCGLMLLR